MSSFRRLYHTSLVLVGARCLPAASFRRKVQHAESLEVASEVGLDKLFHLTEAYALDFLPSNGSVIYPTKRAVCFPDS